MNIHVDHLQRQAALEIEMTGVGKARYRSRVEKNIDAERGASTASGRHLVTLALDPLSKGVTGFVNDVFGGRPGPRNIAAKLIREMDPYVVAYLTTRAILNRLMQRNSVALLTLARLVAREIEGEARFEAFAATKPQLYGKVAAGLSKDGATEQHKRTVLTYAMNRYDVPWDRWSKTEMIHLGVKMIELFCEHTGLAVMVQAIESENRRAPRDQYRIELTDRVTEWVRHSILAGEALVPPHLPTVIPPKDWTGLAGGGYHTEAVRPVPLVRRARPEQAELLKKAHLGAVLGGLNALQRTPWRINRRVLDVMRGLIEAKSDVAGLVPMRDIELPEKPVDIDTNPDALQRWKWAARDVHTANVQLRRDRLTQVSLMEVASRFENEPAIYFPHNLDFRGRAYPIPQVLHPQGSDNVKALLEFAEGKPLGDDGQEWLAIHGANCYGIDKVSFAARVQWVEDHSHRITMTAKDPYADLWWTEADNPWCFLAFCYEWDESVWNPDFVSHIPIALDGSCNGLQHFSAMLLDEVGGAAVNLLPSKEPQDIYQVVADRVMAVLRSYASDNGSDPERERWAQGWLHFGVDRKVTKRPVMVLPYGGTPRSCVRYVEEAIMAKIAAGQRHNFGDELKKAIGFLSSVVWDSIGDVVVAARSAMDWLQQVARVVSARNAAIHWTTPSGFVAYQSYMDMTKRRVRTKIAGEFIKPCIFEETDSINKAKQATSISPNYVHSMDASSMILTVAALEAEGISSFAMIHDSYGTHACHTTLLARRLREVFVRMYETDPLTHLRDELVHTHGADLLDELPPLPKKGALKIWSVIYSDFFFA